MNGTTPSPVTNEPLFSPQSPPSHERFKSTFKLPFTLLTDSDKRVIGAYGASGPFGLVTRRVTYLVDPAKVIRDAVRADLSAGKHRAFVERAIGAAGAGKA